MLAEQCNEAAFLRGFYILPGFYVEDGSRHIFLV